SAAQFVGCGASGRGRGGRSRAVECTEIRSPRMTFGAESPQSPMPGAALQSLQGSVLTVVEHRIDQKLKCRLRQPLLGETDTEGGSESGAGACPADDESARVDIQSIGVGEDVPPHRLGIVETCRV